jgi:hypothetical protein
MSVEKPPLQRLLELAEDGQLTHRRVFSGDLHDLLDQWHIAIGRKLIEVSMWEDDPRPLTRLGRLELALLRERRTAPRTPSTEGVKPKRRRGRKPATDPVTDRRLCEDWKVARREGTTREAFARERGIAVQDLIDAQHREKYRRRRDAE